MILCNNLCRPRRARIYSLLLHRFAMKQPKQILKAITLPMIRAGSGTRCPDVPQSRCQRRHLGWLVCWLAVPLSLGCSHLPSHRHAALCEPECLETDFAFQPPLAGTQNTQKCVQELPCEAVPVAPGTYVNAWSDTMAESADRQHEIITRNYWYQGGEQLGPDGRLRVTQIAESFAQYPRIVLLEEEPVAIAREQSYEEALEQTRQLNLQRKNAVIDALAQQGISGAESMVLFTTDRSVGVRGVEAPNVYNAQYSGGMGMGGRGGMFGGGMGGMFGGGMMGGGMMGGGMMRGGMFGGGMF